MRGAGWLSRNESEAAELAPEKRGAATSGAAPAALPLGPATGASGRAHTLRSQRGSLGAGQGPLPPPVSLYSGPCAAPPPRPCASEFLSLGDDCRGAHRCPWRDTGVSQRPAWEGCTERLVRRAQGPGPRKCALPAVNFRIKLSEEMTGLVLRSSREGRTDTQFSPPERG